MAYKFNITSSGTKTLKTAGRYMLKDVSIDTPTGSCTVSGGELKKGTASGGELSGGELNLSSSSITPSVSIGLSGQTTTDVSITDTKPSSGYYLTLSGSSSSSSSTVTRAAVTRAAFSQRVTRAAITDAYSDGYISKKPASTVIDSTYTDVSLAADSTTIPKSTQTVTVKGGSKTRYVVIPSGSCTIESDSSSTTPTTTLPVDLGLIGDSEITPTLSITLSAQTTTGVSITDTEPSSGYYLTLSGSSSTSSSTVKLPKIKMTHVRGWIPASTTLYAEQSQVINVKAGSKTRYITIPASTIGSATANTTATAASTIRSGNQVTVSKGYHSSDRIIRAAAATAASGFSLSITDKSTAVTVGALSNGSYPLTTSLTGTFSASTVGTFSSGSATDSSVKVGTISAGSCTVSGGGLTPGSGSASLSSNSNVTLSTDNNGISVTATGSGTVNRAAITDAYSAGYISEKSASTVSGLEATSESSNSATQTKYIKAINIPGTATFTVTNSGYLTVTNNGGMSLTANSGEVLINTSTTSDANIGLAVSSSNANVVVNKNEGTISVSSNTSGIIKISDSAGGTIRWGNWEITMDSSGNLVYTYAS